MGFCGAWGIVSARTLSMAMRKGTVGKCGAPVATTGPCPTQPGMGGDIVQVYVPVTHNTAL